MMSKKNAKRRLSLCFILLNVDGVLVKASESEISLSKAYWK